MVPFPCMCNGTSTFNGLPTIGLCAERVVRFMVMISAEGLPVEDVELFIREGLLAFVAVEAVAVVFALELAIRGRDGLLFDRPVAPSALHNRKEDALVTEVRGPNVRERLTYLGQIHRLPTPLAEHAGAFSTNPAPV